MVGGSAATDAGMPRLRSSPSLSAPRRWRFPGNRVWLAGILLFSNGNLLNFASFAFAAQSLLSALGTVQFISNILFGRYVNKEQVRCACVPTRAPSPCPPPVQQDKPSPACAVAAPPAGHPAGSAVHVRRVRWLRAAGGLWQP